MTGERLASRALAFLFIAVAAGACAYDFDGLIAEPGAGGASNAGGTAGTDGAGGAGGSAGTNAGGASGTADGGLAGSAGKGGSAGSSGRGGSAGSGGGSGKAGSSADAASDRAADVRSDTAFDCAAVSGTVFQGHCYYASPVAGNWDSAQSTGCAAPSHLVTITSSAEQNVAAGILAGQERWIGMRRNANAPDMESSFRWVTNEALGFRSWEVYEAGAPEPNFTGDCVRMRPSNNWADAACNESRPAVCERE